MQIADGRVRRAAATTVVVSLLTGMHASAYSAVPHRYDETTSPQVPSTEAVEATQPGGSDSARLTRRRGTTARPNRSVRDGLALRASSSPPKSLCSKKETVRVAETSSALEPRSSMSVSNPLLTTMKLYFPRSLW